MLTQVRVSQILMELLNAFLLTCHCLLCFHPRASSVTQHLSRGVTKMLKQYKIPEFTAQQVCGLTRSTEQSKTSTTPHPCCSGALCCSHHLLGFESTWAGTTAPAKCHLLPPLILMHFHFYSVSTEKQSMTLYFLSFLQWYLGFSLFEICCFHS